MAKRFLEDKIIKGLERQVDAKKRGETLPQLYRGFGQKEIDRLQQLTIELYQEDGQNLTEIGLAFFITLFLEKPDAAQFLDKMPFIKKASNDLLLKEWLWTFTCRMPQPKLESSDISMDILNELHRAPKPLFNFLSTEDKQRFEVDFHHEDDALMEALGNQKTTLRRKENRFPYFAMRVMDDTKMFDELRFNIHLGKWLRKSYASEIIKDRKIYENLRTFGRLSYYSEENAPYSWKMNAKRQSTEEGEKITNWYNPEIEQFAPQYLTTGNRIGIQFLANNKEGAWYALKDYQPTLKEEIKKKELKKERFQATAMLSTYELPNLYFYQYLHRKGLINDSAETLLKNHIEVLYRFCNDALNEVIEPVAKDNFVKKIIRPKEPRSEKNSYTHKEFQKLEDRKVVLQMLMNDKYPGLLVKHLPNHLREYLLGYDTSNIKIIESKLNQRKRDTQRLQRDLNRAVEKILTKERLVPQQYANITLAKLLTEDIMAWRPKDRQKRESPKKEARLLETILLNFPHHKMALEEHIMGNRRGRKFPKSMRLIESKYEFAHPFLHKVNPMERNDLREFYKYYLEEKVIWLTQLQLPPRANEPRPNKYFRKRLGNTAKNPAIAEAMESAKAALPDIASYLDTQEKVLGGSGILKNGDLATYLVQDIIFLKPKNETEGAKNFDKPNNQEYKRLHSMLALYSSDKEGLVDLMEQLGLLGKQKDNPYAHPFLYRTEPSERHGIKDFYEHYIREKLNWIEGLEKEIKKGNTKRYTKYFGMVRSPKKVKRYDNIPVLLPRGLFNHAIVDALMEKGDLDVQEEDNFVRCLAAYLSEETQPFYKWSRTYEVEGVEKVVWRDNIDEWETHFDTTKKTIARLEREKGKLQRRRKKLSEKDHTELKQLKRLKRKAMSNEQSIRMYQHIDRVLLLMLRELTVAKRPQDAFYLDAAKIQLSTILPEDRNQKALSDSDATSSSKGNLLNEPIIMEMEVAENRIVDILSIKRHGEFRRFFKDRRLGNLVKYFSKENRQHDVLKGLFDYFKGLDSETATVILRYLKSKPEEIVEAIKEEGFTEAWNNFDKNWRLKVTKNFDKDIFEISHLQQVVEQLTEETILRRHLVREIKEYGSKRELVFASVLSFEEKVAEVLPTQFKEKVSSKDAVNQGYLSHKTILEMAQNALSKDRLSDDLLKELGEFRNGMGHNEIYFSEHLKESITDNSEEIIAPLMTAISNSYQRLVRELGRLKIEKNTN